MTSSDGYTISRVFDAPRDLVWQCWTSPEHFAVWFGGHDGVMTAVEGLKAAGKPDPKAVRDALWTVSFMGVNGPIKFEKDGPAGKESGQSKPSIFIVQIKDGKIALPAFAAKK